LQGITTFKFYTDVEKKYVTVLWLNIA